MTIGRLTVRLTPDNQWGFFRTWTWHHNGHGRSVRFWRVLFIWRRCSC